MPTYGLTTDGLLIKTLSVIREELNQRILDTWGASFHVDDRSFLGQLNGIISEVAALVWELAEQINSSQDPDKATGAALDALCLLTGTFRPPASFSRVLVTLTGSPTTVVPADSKVKTESTLVNFELITDATIEALDDWASSTDYDVGDRVTNNDKAYECTTAGTSDTTGGPSTTDIDIDDATVVWTYLGEGTGAVDVVAQAVDAGSVQATARDLNVIVSPVSGWDSVVNLLDASLGRAEASDEELRLLREAELAGAGNSPVDAIRADLLNIDGVVAVTVFANNTDTTDSDGMPPHSVEALVRGPLSPTSDFDQSIFDALLANVAAGIQTWGNPSGGVTGTAEDSQGVSHTIQFSRPTEVPIYIIVNVTKDADTYPADGDDLIKEAIVEWGDAQLTGKDAVASAITAKAFSVDGVLDVTSVKIGTSNPPTTSTTVAISLRELATYDKNHITVISTDGTP